MWAGFFWGCCVFWCFCFFLVWVVDRAVLVLVAYVVVLGVWYVCVCLFVCYFGCVGVCRVFFFLCGFFGRVSVAFVWLFFYLVGVVFVCLCFLWLVGVFGFLEVW